MSWSTARAAASEPAGEPLFGEAQAAEVFVAGEDPHLIRRGLHDLRRSSIANVACVCAAVATVTDDMNPARSREIHASLHGATAATKSDDGHFTGIRNERARLQAPLAHRLQPQREALDMWLEERSETRDASFLLPPPLDAGRQRLRAMV